MSKLFPIIGGPALPWDMLEPHEAQAQRNHEQSLERLAQRGGLDPSEAVAVLEDRKWRLMDGAAARDRLADLVEAYEQKEIAKLREENERLKNKLNTDSQAFEIECLKAQVTERAAAMREECAKWLDARAEETWASHRPGSYGDLGWDAVAQSLDRAAEAIRALPLPGETRNG